MAQDGDFSSLAAEVAIAVTCVRFQAGTESRATCGNVSVMVSAPRVRFDGNDDFSAVCLHNTPTDGHSQAGPFGFGTEEGVKSLFASLVREADAVVANDDLKRRETAGDNPPAGQLDFCTGAPIGIQHTHSTEFSRTLRNTCCSRNGSAMTVSSSQSIFSLKRRLRRSSAQDMVPGVPPGIAELKRLTFEDDRPSVIPDFVQ